MDQKHYKEIKESFNKIQGKNILESKKIFLFGHCNVTEVLADLFLESGYTITAILDNNESKMGKKYKNIPIQMPNFAIETDSKRSVVCIATRFYESMKAQLHNMGYSGDIIKMLNYNTFEEYSLSEDTIGRKKEMLQFGIDGLYMLDQEYPNAFFVCCPFIALGDIYYTMSYLPYFFVERDITPQQVVICVSGEVCKKVVSLFGEYVVIVFEQDKLNAIIQALIFENRKRSYICHQDRPYVVNLACALYLKKIPLELIYRCGIFGLKKNVSPILPFSWREYPFLNSIYKGNAIIVSPYAKSVVALSEEIWNNIIAFYKTRGFQVFTNISGDEKPLEGTFPICPNINELKSVVEEAGMFIGIRSGLCDVIKTANCRKIALYPEYNYMDTKWKAIDIYSIDGFENIEVKEGFVWKG